MNIHLVGSIVDSPEIFWAQPDLGALPLSLSLSPPRPPLLNPLHRARRCHNNTEPLYSAARSYLEIPQRIDLLNARVEVLQDMLQLLKDQVTSSHSEWLEIVVIGLILLECVWNTQPRREREHERGRIWLTLTTNCPLCTLRTTPAGSSSA
jgi:hypothetical protein